MELVRVLIFQQTCDKSEAGHRDTDGSIENIFKSLILFYDFESSISKMSRLP